MGTGALPFQGGYLTITGEETVGEGSVGEGSSSAANRGNIVAFDVEQD